MGIMYQKEMKKWIVICCRNSQCQLIFSLLFIRGIQHI